MDKEVLEVVLKQSYNDFKIKRIIEVKTESALPKGENYTSTILKLTLKVVLGNGRIAKKSFLTKKASTGEAAERFKTDYNMFQAEVSIYNNIIREMDYLLEEFEETEGPLWCKFIHYNMSESIMIIEDLKASGFANVKRTEAQDLDHARLVVRSLGRFHAMAKILETRGLISKDDYKPYPFLNDDAYIRNLSYGGFRALVKGMRTGWGEEWAEYTDKLSQVSFDEYRRRVKECGNFDDNTFKCLIHGDCWNNNIMFKHNWEGRPTELRFIDLQISHYSSPCMDVIYFLSSSVKKSVRHQNLKSLIALYHESLISSLDRFDYKGPKPSLGDINEAMKRLSFFGLCFTVAWVPCFLSPRKDVFDLDKLMETNGEEGFDISVYYEDGIIEKIGEDIKKLVKLLES